MIMASPPTCPPPPPLVPSDASASPSAVKRHTKPYAYDHCLLDHLAEFEIPEASDADQDGVEDTVCEKYDINKEKWLQFCQTRKDPSWEDVCKKAQAIQKQNTTPHVLSREGYEYLEQRLLIEKTKKKLEEAAQSRSVDGVIDPTSPVRRHMKWKMARTKKIGEMTNEAAKEITEKIDVLTATIGRPEHPRRVHAAGAGVTIKQYFGSAPRTSCSSSSLPPEELQQLTQQIRDQLEESITEKVTWQLMASFNQMQSQIQFQMQSQGFTLPPEPLVRLVHQVDPACLVALGRVCEGSTVVHNTPLLPDQVKVGVEEVTDVDAPIPVPTYDISLVGQTLHTFLAWPTHLVKSLSQQVLYSYYMFLLFKLIHSACLKLGHLTLFHEHVVVSPEKPPPKPDPEVDDSLYLMTLTIPELFLRPYQVTWDATVFGIFNPYFPLYIKHEDLSEIAHGGQCLSISVLQLWILMRAGNSDIYRFLEPQSIQRSGQSQFESKSYIKTWMQSSKHDVYLGAYLNGGHWQMVVILPKEHLVVWFCSLHNRPDNYLKGIINSDLKGLDDAPQPKSKAPDRWIVIKCNRQKGSTECG
ncbi:hypothetical protein HKD37_16G045101 [Glycine soja]